MHTDFDITPHLPVADRRRENVPRLSIDWEAVERDYRAGTLSLRELSRKHGCSHSAIANRAGREGWTRISALTRGNDSHPTGKET